MTYLGFVGDVMINRPDPDAAFSQVRDVLAWPDVLFGNCECVYTTTPHRAPTAPMVLRAHPDNTAPLRAFDVMSLANNHIVDGGHDALLETVELVRAAGAEPVGVGRDLHEAGRHVTVDVSGSRVSYLAYASVFPYGYEARYDCPGLAPCRAHNVERAIGWAPGMVGDVVTVPHEEDHERLAAALLRARKDSEVVVASFHWGDCLHPFVITDHERRTARFAIDRGADVVVGHHHHALRGIEWYRGRPIFYGLGHFVFDQGPRDADRQLALAERFGDAGSYEIYPRIGWPRLSMHPDTRMTMFAWVRLNGPGVPAAAGFLPCALDQDGVVHPHHPDSPAGAAVVDYVRRGCVTQDLPVVLVDGGHRLAGYPTVEAVPSHPNLSADSSPEPHIPTGSTLST